MNDSDVDRAISKVIAHCWADENFLSQLLANPSAVLQEAGVPVRDGLKVNVVQDSDTEAFFVIPPKPKDLMYNDLNATTAGIRSSSSIFCCGHGAQ